jgi:hypothetical protein
VDQFDGTRGDAPVRLVGDPITEVEAGEGSGGAWMELISVERHPRCWTEQVRLAIVAGGLQCVRPCDLTLLEHRLPRRRRDVEPVVRDDAAVVHRVLGGVAKRDEPCLPLERGRLEACHELDRRFGEVERLDEVGSQRADLFAAEDAREPADPDRDRVDRPTAYPGDDGVARPLQPEPALDGPLVALGQGKGARIPEEIRKV